MAYVTPEELASFVRADVLTETDLLEIAISAASGVIDRHCNTTFDDPVPSAVKQACLIQASRFFARRSSPFGIAGSPELGNELRLLARVDPDVAVILSPHIDWWGMV